MTSVTLKLYWLGVSYCKFINLLLTKREGPTGEGQYSPVWLEQAMLVSSLYTAISKKVALVIHDAWSMFHSPQCIMGASLV